MFFCISDDDGDNDDGTRLIVASALTMGPSGGRQAGFGSQNLVHLSLGMLNKGVGCSIFLRGWEREVCRCWRKLWGCPGWAACKCSQGFMQPVMSPSQADETTERHSAESICKKAKRNAFIFPYFHCASSHPSLTQVTLNLVTYWKRPKLRPPPSH